MKIPRNPPTLTEMLREVDSARLDDILAALSTHSPPARYIHWDKLIRYSPPADLTHREWWLGFKVKRKSNYKTVPLLDKKAHTFQYMLTDEAIEMLHQIDMRAGGTIALPDQILNPQLRDRYYVSSVIQEAITSSQLEGATTTRRVAKEMIRSGRPPRDRSERMILNNYHTMLLVEKLKDEPLSQQMIFDLHARITEQTLEDKSATGRFRRADERIIVGDEYDRVFHVPPSAVELEERMAAMCSFANGNTPTSFVHPVIRSIILHFWLAYDHPFVDGNGRTARALFYWSMARHGYWLTEFISISSVIAKARAEYERAYLYSETDDNDLTYFILYHLDVMRDAIEDLHKYIQRKTREIQEVERGMRGLVHFNQRQLALLSHALRNPGFRYTIEGHRTSHGIVHQTARMDLNQLKDHGLFRAEKIGKRWYFTPIPDLWERLEGISRGSTHQLSLP